MFFTVIYNGASISTKTVGLFHWLLDHLETVAVVLQNFINLIFDCVGSFQFSNGTSLWKKKYA